MEHIPQSVIDTDAKLEQAAERSSEELAQHRWHNTLDPDGPGYSLRSYALAVHRNFATVRKYAQGYADWMITTSNHSLSDCLALANLAAEKVEVAEIVAKVEGVTVDTVSKRRGTADSLANVTEQAREAADRKGTTMAEEARAIAERRKQTREMEARDDQRAKAATDHRYLNMEAKIARAKRLLSEALSEGQGVGLDTEHQQLLQSSIDQCRAILNLLDMRVGGAPDIDWDAELESITA